MFAAAGLVGVVAAVWAVVAAVRARPADRADCAVRGGRRRALVSAAIGLVPAVLVGAMLARGLGGPRINGVTTDVDDPPRLPERGPIVRQAYADVAPLVVARPPAEVTARALGLARDRDGWTITHVHEPGGVIRGVARTRLFGFCDDFAIGVRADAGGAMVDMRSKSRDGNSDLGVNAARIRSFLGALACDLDW